MKFLVTGSSSSIGQEVINTLSKNKKNLIYATYSSLKPKINKKNIKLIKYIISDKQRNLNLKLMFLFILLH